MKRVLSDVAYARVADEAIKAGSATHIGEKRQSQGLGLHPLVDPSAYDVIRRSISWLEPEGDHFTLLRGVAMLEETRLDTTGSMGNNVEIAMEVLPATYKLLSSGSSAVLCRYDLQMITSIFGDVCDKYVLCRSQAEMDERIAEQMTYMFPEHKGGDTPEDPQYGLFGGAFLTWTSINQYGLKYYDFTVSDAPGRDYLDAKILVRVFGNSVFEKMTENGYQINPQKLPSTKEVVNSLSQRAHVFFLQVGNSVETAQFWRRIYGSERTVVIPKTELLPYVKAAIIGLTEGVLDIQTTEEFLRNSNLPQTDARQITRAVAGIPIGAQAALPNFGKIPLRGAKFAKKGDMWPIGTSAAAGDEPSVPAVVSETKKEEDDMWL